MTGQKFGNITTPFFKEVSYGHQACIYLVKNIDFQHDKYQISILE